MFFRIIKLSSPVSVSIAREINQNNANEERKMIEVTIKESGQKLIINETDFSFFRVEPKINTTQEAGCLSFDRQGNSEELVETYEEIKIKLGVK